LVRCRINRLTHLDRATGEPIRRYEHKRPGDLIHVDVKKLGKVPECGGWRYVGRLTSAMAHVLQAEHHSLEDLPHHRDGSMLVKRDDFRADATRDGRNGGFGYPPVPARLAESTFVRLGTSNLTHPLRPRRQVSCVRPVVGGFLIIPM
jgi:hypothetical protein